MMNIAGQAKPYLDRELVALVEANPPSVNSDIRAWRKASEAAYVEPTMPHGFSREQRAVPSMTLPPAVGEPHDSQPTGREVELRVITRQGVTPGAVLFVIHGGGYVAGRAKFEDERCCELIKEFGDDLWPDGEKTLVTAAPDYALAPDYPHPAGLEDTVATLRYVRGEWPDVPIILYGDSAGSGMIRQLLARLSEEELSTLAGVIALEPCLSPRMDTPSFNTYADAVTWSAQAAQFSWDAYFGSLCDRSVIEPEVTQVSEDFPPVWLAVNPVDTLRDEGIAWYLSLADAGANVQLHAFPGTFHGWLAGLGTRSWERVKESLRPFIAEAIAQHLAG